MTPDKKVIKAWAFYDWANSVYPLVITTAIFPLYYASSLFPKELPFLGRMIDKTALINYIGAFSFLVVAIISPLLSGVADYVGNKKKFLKIFCYLGAFSCMGLFFFTKENLYIGLLFYVLASIGFWGSLVFYNSYLPEIAPPEMHDNISARGFSLGYIGSVILLVICLVLNLQHKNFGITEEFASKLAFLLTGIWWIAFAQITYKGLPSTKSNKKIQKQVLFNGYKEINNVFKSLSKTIRLKRYLLAFFVYNMGVQTIMMSAVYFAQEAITWREGEQTTGLIIAILLIQLIAIIGAYGMAFLSKKYGNINALKLVVLMWSILCAIGYFITTPLEFYIMAGLVGLIMGGVQSLSRSTYAKFLPPTKDTTSYFSFYDVSEKIGLVIGLFAFGFIEDITGDIRNSILSVMLFFIIGFIILFLVPKQERE